MNHLKIVSKVDELSLMIAMTAHYGALAQVHAIGRCMIGQQHDLLRPEAKLMAVTLSSSVRNTNSP